MNEDKPKLYAYHTKEYSEKDEILPGFFVVTDKMPPVRGETYPIFETLDQVHGYYPDYIWLFKLLDAGDVINVED
jgi:hypothetical protein